MSFLSEHAFGLLGKRLTKKYLIIESDDWGLMMMPSKAAFSQLQASGIPVDTCPYNTYDALETKEDIAQLHEVCNSFKDVKGNLLQITANFIMANPDFEAIRNSKYVQYHYHDLSQTYLKYHGGLETLEAIKEAYHRGTFMPQLHGREHLQVNHWLSALRKGDAETQLAFDAGVFGHPSVYAKKTGIHFLSAFHISSREELAFAGQSVQEASSLFRDTFGFTSKTFIAPRYIWPVELEPYFKQAGIESLQGTLVQLRPEIGKSTVKLNKRINWMGKRNAYGLNYLTRNVFFEPALSPSFDWESDALRRIETAFFWGKPAVISMHRLNFMGGFSQENRTNSLSRLAVLLKAVQGKYPEVEFSSSDSLSDYMYSSRS
jgi:hypothetical protein